MSRLLKLQSKTRMQSAGLCVALRGTDSGQLDQLRSQLQERGLVPLDGDALISAHAVLILSPVARCVEAIRHLRWQDAQLPLMVLSEGWDGRLRTAAYQAGADDCAPWPIESAELTCRLRRLIHRCHGQTEQLLAWNDLVLDPTSCQVRVGSRESKLEPRAFAILRELLLTQGRPISRSRLIDRVWAGEREPSAGALEFQVHRLREALGAERIQTLRGFGYALCEGRVSKAA